MTAFYRRQRYLLVELPPELSWKVFIEDLIEKGFKPRLYEGRGGPRDIAERMARQLITDDEIAEDFGYPREQIKHFTEAERARQRMREREHRERMEEIKKQQQEEQRLRYDKEYRRKVRAETREEREVEKKERKKKRDTVTIAREARDKYILDLHERGLDYKDIAKIVNMGASSISRILGPHKRKFDKRAAAMAERNQEIYDRRKSGMTYRQAGEKWGLSPERVRQIVAHKERRKRYEERKRLPVIPDSPAVFDLLPVRTINILKAEGICTQEDFEKWIKKPDAEKLKTPNLGMKSLREIERVAGLTQEGVK